MRFRIIGASMIWCFTAISCKSGPGPVPEPRKVYSAPAEAGVIRPSAALELIKQTTAESAAKADRIVLARALGARVSQDRGGNIFTYVDFSLTELVKGKMSGKQFTLRLLGGRLGSVEIAGPLDGEFVAGSEYILFLGKDNTDGYPTLNPQSIFSVWEDPGHRRKVAIPGPSGLQLYRAGTKEEASYTENAAYVDDLLYSLKIAGNDQ